MINTVKFSIFISGLKLNYVKFIITLKLGKFFN